MTDDLTCHVDWPCPSLVSVSCVPLAKMSNSKHTGVGGIWHEQGSPQPGPLCVCAGQVLAAGLLSTTGNALGFSVRAHHASPDQSCPPLLSIGADNNPKSN